MFTKKSHLRAAGASLAAIVLLTAQPLRAQSSSDTARIEKLEQRGGNAAKTKRAI